MEYDPKFLDDSSMSLVRRFEISISRSPLHRPVRRATVADTLMCPHVDPTVLFCQDTGRKLVEVEGYTMVRADVMLRHEPLAVVM